MAQASGRYLKNRLLRLKVGFLLTEGPGSAREMPLSIPQRVQVDGELFLESLSGSLVLTRTREGILAQGGLRVRRKRECDRCLTVFEQGLELDIAELFALPADAGKSAFSVDSNGEIDLGPLLREEVLIAASYRAFCRDGCRGLNVETGGRLNDEAAAAAAFEVEGGSVIDPRLAMLKKLLPQQKMTEV